MRIENVGLMSPGDMGQAVAIQIKAKGVNIYTALEHRSERTRALACEAGLTDVRTVTRLLPNAMLCSRSELCGNLGDDG